MTAIRVKMDLHIIISFCCYCCYCVRSTGIFSN